MDARYVRGGGPGSGSGVFGEAAARVVVFTDVAGYTAETHDMGDERAAVIALKLREHADETARQTGGRLVKLLGDGAILMFRAPGAAFAGTRLLARSWPTDLPGLHTGIGIGPVLEIDGDVYGSTVNLAARLSQVARPGQILVASLAGPETVQGEGSFQPNHFGLVAKYQASSAGASPSSRNDLFLPRQWASLAPRRIFGERFVA